MQKFCFEDTALGGVKIITPFFSNDERGYFSKYFEKEIFSKNGIEMNIEECLQSFSIKNVLRGLHIQKNKPQAKLVRAVSGEIFDVAVDVREESPDFGKWVGVRLSGENKKSLYIPRGFAHGFLTLSDNAVVSYMCDNKYYPEDDGGYFHNDHDIGINWPIERQEDIIISAKDMHLPCLADRN